MTTNVLRDVWRLGDCGSCASSHSLGIKAQSLCQAAISICPRKVLHYCNPRLYQQLWRSTQMKTQNCRSSPSSLCICVANLALRQQRRPARTRYPSSQTCCSPNAVSAAFTESRRPPRRLRPEGDTGARIGGQGRRDRALSGVVSAEAAG